MAGGASENSGATITISATIDPQMLEFLISSLQAPQVERHHALALSSPSSRASPAENGHGSNGVVRRHRVIYVGGVLCRAFPGVHVEDAIREDSDAINSSNSISRCEAKAMSLSYLSIALFGCTDDARDVAEVVITADEDEDDTFYMSYDKISPVLYLFANVIDYSGDSATSNRSKGCFSCG